MRLLPKKEVETGHYCEGSMTAVDDALDSTNKCTESATTKDCAGANARSRGEMAFITTSPLSELVWSPEKGLSLKNAKSSSNKRKASLLWNTEVFNIMVLPQSSKNDAEASTAGNAMDELPHSNFHTATSTSHVQSTTGTQPLKMMQEHDFSSLPDMASYDKRAKQVVVDKENEHDMDGDGEENRFSPLMDKKLVETHSLENKNFMANVPETLRSKSSDRKEEDKCSLAVRDLGTHLRDSVEINNQKASGFLHASASENAVHSNFGGLVRSTSGLRDADDGCMQLAMNSVNCTAADNFVDGKLSVGERSVDLQERNNLGRIGDTFGASNNRISSSDIRPHEYKVSDMKDSGSILKEKADSDESVESNNSKELSSRVKGARSCELEISSGSKRIKKEAGDNRHESSFLNWISSMINGISRPHQEPILVTPLSQRKEAKTSSLAEFHGKGKEFSCKSTSLQSSFQALFLPNSNLHESRSHDRGCNKEILQFEENALSKHHKISCDVADARLKSCKPVEKSQTFATNDFYQARLNYNIEVNHMRGKGHCQRSFGHSDSGFLEQLTTRKVTCSINKSTNLPNNKHSTFVESLWVSRFSSNRNVTIHNQEEPKQATNTDMEVLPGDCNTSNSMSIENIPNKREDNLKNWKSYFGGPRSAVYMQDNSSSKTVDYDQKVKSNLNHIQPSAKLNKSKPILSVFAKRLDALKQSIPLKSTTGTTSAVTTCFFCGGNGHSLIECTKSAEPEKVDVLSNMTSYECAENFSCMCIRCFQLNHWSIACPDVSAKVKKPTNSDILHMNSENCVYLRKKPKNPSSSCDGRIEVWNGNKKISQENEGVEPDITYKLTSSSTYQGSPKGRSSNEYQVTVKQDCGSMQDELKGPQIIQPCSVNAAEITDVSGIFEAIRSLRLSRSDVIRYLASPKSDVNLVGYFLRLRLGKRKAGACGTGYHVARVNGAGCGNSLSVSIGNLPCTVDCRFVSNHDFTEDELTAWWVEASKDGSKVPSIFELNKKLTDRQNTLRL